MPPHGKDRTVYRLQFDANTVLESPPEPSTTQPMTTQPATTQPRGMSDVWRISAVARLSDQGCNSPERMSEPMSGPGPWSSQGHPLMAV